jgi:hypothetical protein
MPNFVMWAWPIASCAPKSLAQLPSSPTILEAGPPAARWQALNSSQNRQDAQSAPPVGTDLTTEQSPATLETNDADDTRISRDEVPPLG